MIGIRNSRGPCSYQSGRIMSILQGWEKLLIELNRAKRFQIDTFRKYFLDTYQVLKKDLEEAKIEKSHVPLVAKAFLFANAECKDVDARFRAALVLTERMLTDCAFRTYPTVPEGSEIYILEARRDVYVDFNNPGESVAILEKAFDERFWNSL